MIDATTYFPTIQVLSVLKVIGFLVKNLLIVVSETGLVKAVIRNIVTKERINPGIIGCIAFAQAFPISVAIAQNPEPKNPAMDEANAALELTRFHMRPRSIGIANEAPVRATAMKPALIPVLGF
jgi:hypothetical protein